MKNAGIYKVSAAVIALCAAYLWSPGADGTEKERWPKLPKLMFQRCVATDRAIKHNPFSKFRNDFYVVIKYEEFGDTGPLLGKEWEGSDRDEALNVYVVLGVFLARDKPVAVVHETALIVEKKNTVPDQSKSPILRRWLLLDENGDGLLDRAMFSRDENELTEENGKSPEMELPRDHVARLQDYFEKAVRSLSRKAADGSAKTCIPA